jgi:hypothetical protein
MNFRSIDPRAPGEGMSGASETDRAVWREFYNPHSSTLLTDALHDEFARLWGATASEDHTSPPQANATAAMIEDEALRLEELTLDELLAGMQSRRRRTRAVLPGGF